VIVIMAGLTESFESEGFDRKHLNIPKNQESLIDAISSIYKNVIVVLSNGAPILMPWKDQVHGIVEGYLGGQASGLALMDILMGDINPSGKLAETFPNSLEEIPSSANFPGETRQVIYQEGLYIGYRAFDSMNLNPLFPFGHGLSYTSFVYSNLSIQQNQDILELKFMLQNSGNKCGKEIIQVYVSKENSVIYRPLQELKTFKKIELQPQEIKEVTLNIPLQNLAIYQDGFKIESGIYLFRVGSSSRDIRLEQTYVIETQDVIKEDNALPYHNISQNFKPTRDDYELIFGSEIPPVQNVKPYHLNSTIGEIKHTMIGKMLYKMIRKEYGSIAGNQPTQAMIEMLEASVNEMPLRSLVLFSDGKLSKRRTLGMIDFMNHRFLKGVLKLIKG
ncbi:MAG: glycoside hydrolase family 3 C-terminal domain-containing protein, partial [Acholeplasmataceae bacterium]